MQNFEQGSCGCVECLFEDDCDRIYEYLSRALGALRRGDVRAARVFIGRARSIALDWI